MLRVRDLLELPELADARPVLDNLIGYDNVITGLGILDYEPLLNRYYTFEPTEAVVAGLGFSRGDQAVAEEALIEQMRSGIAAIFIKDMLFTRVSDDVIRVAQETSTPIFFFTQAYMENLTAASLNAIAAEQGSEGMERAIDVLRATRSAQDERDLFHTAFGIEGHHIMCAAFSLIDASDNLARTVIARDCMAFLKSDSIVEARIVHYHLHIFAFISLESNDAASELAAGQRCDALRVGMRSVHSCGTSQVVDPGDIHLAIEQALQAADAAEKGTTLRWADMGFGMFASAARSSDLMSAACRSARLSVQEYDSTGVGDLDQTLRVLVECEGSINDAAAALSMHPNSVRNRIGVAKKLWGIPDANERVFYAYLMLAYLDDMML